MSILVLYKADIKKDVIVAPLSKQSSWEILHTTDEHIKDWLW